MTQSFLNWIAYFTHLILIASMNENSFDAG